MDLVLRGRRISEEDLAFIRSLIADSKPRGRVFLSRTLCRQWGWVQPNGALKDAACRALLLQLQARGLLQLPARQAGVIAGQRRSLSSSQQPLLPLSDPPLSAPESGPVVFQQLQWRLAQSGREALLYKELIARHHYLGYRRAIGPTVRYLVYAQERPIACLGWAAAAWKVASRDHFIGWNTLQRQKNLHRLVSNTRFLILSRTPHLASHLLGRACRRLTADWQALTGQAPVLLETYVDTTRFAGTCYKAANWTCVGLTQGRGKYDRTHQDPTTVKAVFVYPLAKNFRQVLTHE